VAPSGTGIARGYQVPVLLQVPELAALVAVLVATCTVAGAAPAGNPCGGLKRTIIAPPDYVIYVMAPV